VFASCVGGWPRKVDVRLPGRGNSNSRGARPVHLIISMIKWIRTSRLSIKNSLCVGGWGRDMETRATPEDPEGARHVIREALAYFAGTILIGSGDWFRREGFRSDWFRREGFRSVQQRGFGHQNH